MYNLYIIYKYRVFNKIWYHLRCKYDRNYMVKVNEIK